MTNKQGFSQVSYEGQRRKIANEVQKSEFIAFLSDGSTDTSVTEEEIVYVRFLRENYPVTVYVANKALEKADVEGITAAVVSAMKDELEVSEWQDKLVGCALDGAAVNIGRLRGVGARLKSDNAEHLIVVLID